jgi:hypothetical protein
MTPKEKAEDLFDKFCSITGLFTEAKQCALIAVDEIINNFGTRTTGQEFYTEYRAVEYYQQVKTEIEKL